LVVDIARHRILRRIRIGIRLICWVDLIRVQGFYRIRLGSLRETRTRDSRVNPE
jgi:hypothetical protein